MKKTFNQQVETLTRYYHAGLLNPMCRRHSFIGLIAPELQVNCGGLHMIDDNMTSIKIDSSMNISKAKQKLYEAQSPYTLNDLIHMENVFLMSMNHVDPTLGFHNAMCTTIKVLKAIHERQGETCYYEPIQLPDYKVMIINNDFVVKRSVDNDIQDLIHLLEAINSLSGIIKNREADRQAQNN